MNKLNKILLLLLVITSTNCERDDICAEGTLTTPQLVINFNNVTSPEDSKNVVALTVTPLDDMGNDLPSILTSSTVNTISVPLRIQDETETDPITTSYKLIKNAGSETEENTDIINITYTTEFIYVSRACGFRSIFNLDPNTQTAFNVDVDGDNWILSFNIDNFTIDNENEAHITIFH
ncbi:DUF6452 family protein [Winogradskyella sp. 3972H.M.0a.05]|uniref:DUF6452 family protein n=1 Tax=Winogradskyella sp. 3972H.M.0a.05 TaxID=2950277 RepID=UPI003396890E